MLITGVKLIQRDTAVLVMSHVTGDEFKKEAQDLGGDCHP
jgi:hypothetical protein